MARLLHAPQLKIPQDKVHANPLDQVLALFKKIVRPEFTWKNFSLEEQGKILKAGRSNCKLDTTKLVDKMKEYSYEVTEIHEAYKACFRRMVANGAHGKTNGTVNGAAPVKSAMKRKRVDDEETTIGKTVKVS